MKNILLILITLSLSSTLFSQTRSSDNLPIEWLMITSIVNANGMIGQARKTEDYLYVGLCKKYLDSAQSSLDYLKSRKEISSKFANLVQETIDDMRRINTKATNMDFATSKLHWDINFKIFDLAKHFFHQTNSSH